MKKKTKKGKTAKKTKRELIALVPAEDIDEDAFANAMADAIIADIQRTRKEQGLPPLEE
jgi:hypothetical protein